MTEYERLEVMRIDCITLSHKVTRELGSEISGKIKMEVIGVVPISSVNNWDDLIELEKRFNKVLNNKNEV